MYLLDTNACIAVINGTPEAVRMRLERALARGEDVYIPTVAAFELWYGVEKSSRREFNAKRVEAFLNGPLKIFAFSEEDAVASGEIRAHLEARGSPIGAYNLLIAGQAVARGLILVTANSREFSRIRELRMEDWSRK